MRNSQKGIVVCLPYFLRLFFGLLLPSDASTLNMLAPNSPPSPCRNDNAFSTACFLTFSGTFSQYTSSRLPSTCSATIGLSCEGDDATLFLIQLSDDRVLGCASRDPEASNPVVCAIGLERRSCTSCWACKGVRRRTWHCSKL